MENTIKEKVSNIKTAYEELDALKLKMNAQQFIAMNDLMNKLAMESWKDGYKQGGDTIKETYQIK